MENKNRFRGENLFLTETIEGIKSSSELDRRQLIESHEEQMSILGLDNLSLRLKISDQEALVIYIFLFNIHKSNTLF